MGSLLPGHTVLVSQAKLEWKCELILGTPFRNSFKLVYKGVQTTPDMELCI